MARDDVGGKGTAEARVPGGVVRVGRDAGGVLRTASSAAVVVALADTVGRWVAVAALGTGARPVGFALVAAALVVGRPARWGSAAGLLAAGVLLGDWAGGVVRAAAAFAATTVAVRLWIRGGDRDAGWLEWLPSYVVVATTVVLAFAATSATLSDVLGRAAFGVALERIVATTLPLALVGAPLVRPIAERAAGTSWSLPSRPLPGRSRAVVVGTVLCWTVGGYVGGFLFATVEQAPEGAFARRFSPSLETFISLWGPRGTYAQLLLGAAALAVLAVVLRQDRSERS